MKKSFKTVVAAFLLLVMLFSVSVTTIFAIEEAPSIGGGDEGFDPIPDTPSEVGTSLDLGWISVALEGNTINITWYHEINQMLHTIRNSPGQIKELSSVLVEGLKQIVKDSFTGEGGGEGGDGGFDFSDLDFSNPESVFKSVLKLYLISLGKEIASNDKDYKIQVLTFFVELLTEENMSAEGSKARAFSNYMCTLIEQAVSFGAISMETLTGMISDGAALEKYIKDYAETAIVKEIETVLTEYVKQIKGEPNEFPEELEEYVAPYAVSFARRQINFYLDGDKENQLVIDEEILDSFIISEITKVLKVVLPQYADKKLDSSYVITNPNLEPGELDPYASLYKFAFDEIDSYIKTAIENYVVILCGGTPAKGTALDGALQDNVTVSDVLTEVINSELKSLINYVKVNNDEDTTNDIKDEPATYAMFDAALKSYFTKTYGTDKISLDMIDSSLVGILELKETDVLNQFNSVFETEYGYLVKGEKSDNYAIIESFFNSYFDSITKLSDLPKPILIAYLDNAGNKTALLKNFKGTFSAEYDKIVKNEASALKALFVSAFETYLANNKSYGALEPIIRQQLVATYGENIKTEFVATRLDTILSDLVEYVATTAPLDRGGVGAPLFYKEFRDAFGTQSVEISGEFEGVPFTKTVDVTLDDVYPNGTEGEITAADVFTEGVKDTMLGEMDTKIRAAVGDIITYVTDGETGDVPTGFAEFEAQFDSYIAKLTVKFDDIDLSFFDDETVKDFVESQALPMFEGELEAIISFLKTGENQPDSYEIFEGVFETYLSSNKIILANVPSSVFGKVEGGVIKPDEDVKAIVKGAINFPAKYQSIIDYIKYYKGTENDEENKPLVYDLFAKAFEDAFGEIQVSLLLFPKTVPLSFLEAYVSDTDKNAVLIAQFKASLKPEDAESIMSLLGGANGIFDKIAKQENGKEKLKDIVASVSDETIANAISDLLKNDDSYKAKFKPVINAMNDGEIMESLKQLLLEDKFDVAQMITKVKEEFIGDRIGTLSEIVKHDYDATLVRLKNSKPGEINLEMLLNSVNGISVNGRNIVVVDGGIKPNMSALRALLGDIPSPAAIPDMSDAALKNFINWPVVIDTMYGELKFNIKLSVGANYSEFRKTAESIFDLIDVERDKDGKITLNVNFFDTLYDVLKGLFESDKISPALKVELFEIMDMTVEELCFYFLDSERFTFADYHAIISSIDFESFLEDFGIVGVTNDDILMFIDNMEWFDKIREKLSERFDSESLPDAVANKTLFDFYSGNGTFSYAESIAINVKPIISNILSRVDAYIPSEFSQLTTMIKNAIGNRVLDIDFEINVSVPRLHKITYSVTHPETGIVEERTGLLPEGVSIMQFFTENERYKGYLIEAWSLNEDGTDVIDKMPGEDIKVYATLEKLSTSITVNNGYESGITFETGKDYALSVKLEYSFNTAEPDIKYQWFKNDKLIEGAESSTLTIKGNVSDSGEYWCRITIVKDGELENVVFTKDMCDVIIVSISRRVLVSDIKNYVGTEYTEGYDLAWNYTVPFNYDGTAKHVTLNINKFLAASPEIMLNPEMPFTNVEKTNAGKYYARAYFMIRDEEERNNYVLLRPDGTVSHIGYVELEWEILPIIVNESDIDYEWSIKDGESFTYDAGKTYSVTLKLNDKDNILKISKYTGAEASQAGKYTTEAVIELNDSNYVINSDGNDGNGIVKDGKLYLTREWSIAKKLIDLRELLWNYNPEENPYVYSGEELSVSVVGVPGDIVWIYEGNTATEAGVYVATAEPDPNNFTNANNYIFKGTVPKCEWSIEKQTIETLIELEWNYTDAFVYDGFSHVVELNIPEEMKAGLKIEYKNNVASEAGEYLASAKVVAIDSKNFEAIGEISFELPWTINKKDVDMSGVSFEDKSVIYDGKAHSIVIGGTLPEGVSVSYSAAKTEPGTYEMTASFIYNEANYNAIAPMTATLTILPKYDKVQDFENKDSSGNVILKIEAANGIPENLTLNVKNLSAQYFGYDFGNFFGYNTTGKILSVYDIHFAENGTETPVSDKFNVQLIIPENFTGNVNNLRVVYISESGDITDMKAMVDGDYVSFETRHFSVYAIVEVIDGNVQASDGFDYMSVIPYAAASAVLLLLVLIIIRKSKKKRGPEEPGANENDEPTPESPADSAEEAPIEEAPMEEAPAEEAPIEEAPAEEAPVEEAPTEEAPAEAIPAEEKNSLVIHDNIDAIGPAPQDSETGEATEHSVVHVRCRSSFMSRLIQSEPPIQDYYTILKNALLSYKSVKAKLSFNFESFNSSRVQCAKLNVKGRSILVYLGLDLADYNVNKYHFTDASDKPKFEKVPMMLKVKSERGLKYALELIEEVMKKNGFEKNPKFVEEDYHMPYETTAALAERELVKLILPQGVSLAEGIKLVKADVGALLDEAKSQDDDDED